MLLAERRGDFGYLCSGRLSALGVSMNAVLFFPLPSDKFQIFSVFLEFS